MIRGLDISERPSPNYNDRADDVSMLVFHYTGMPTLSDSLDRLCSPASEVSCHFLVAEDGRACRLVGEERRAWHAGDAFWRGETDINSISIGIELQNPGQEWGYRDFPDVQITTLIALVRDLRTRHEIPDRNIVGHADVAPGRKTDPGEKFPWDRMAEAGIGLWPGVVDEPGGAIIDWTNMPAVMAVQDGLVALGFKLQPTGTYCDDTKSAVTAFQRHWQQSRTDGMADQRTVALLEALLKRI